MAEKMIIIPEKIWNQGEDIERRKTIYPTLYRMEDDIHKLLVDYQLNDYDKVKLLNQVQQRYKNIYSSREQPPVKIDVSPDITTSRESPIYASNVNAVLTNLPQKLHHKARPLLEILKHTGHIEWNDKDGYVKIDGIKIEGSNIQKLIRNVLQTRPYKIEPIGWSLFSQHLPSISKKHKESVSWIESH